MRYIPSSSEARSNGQKRAAQMRAQQQTRFVPHKKAKPVKAVDRPTWWICPPDEFYARVEAERQAREARISAVNYSRKEQG